MARKKNKNTFANDDLPEFDELDTMPQEDENPQWDDDESEESAPQVKTSKKDKKGAKNKKGSKKKANDDFLPELDELEEPMPQTHDDDDEETPAPAGKKGKKGKKDKNAGKKGGKKGKKDDDDMLPELDELDQPQDEDIETEESSNKKGKKKKTKEDLLNDLDTDAVGDKQLTKKELKRLKKEQAKQKEKEQKKKQTQQETKAEPKPKEDKKESKKAEKPADDDSKASKKGGAAPKKLNARLLAVKQAQEAKLRREREIQEQIEREEQERLEAERILQEKRDEEKRQRDEEKRRAEEEIAEQKRLGIYMTEAQKAKIEKQRQQMIAMLERQGKGHLIDQLLAEGPNTAELKDKKKFHVVGRDRKKDKKGGKKGGKKDKQAEETGTSEQAPQKQPRSQEPAQPNAFNTFQKDVKKYLKDNNLGKSVSASQITPIYHKFSTGKITFEQAVQEISAPLTTISEPEPAESKKAKAAPKQAQKPKEESDDELDNWEDMSLSEESDKEEPAREVKKAAPVKEKAPAEKKSPEKKSAETKGTESQDSDASDSEEWDDSSSDEEVQSHTQKAVKMSKFQKAQMKKQREVLQKEEQEQLQEGQHFRNPICCVLGHVDTGKTLILDKIRSTNVQSGEAGGITQQIGATYIPADAIETQTSKLAESGKVDLKVPGLLIIDTPGHESFTNLRSRGTSLCDIAILVVDVLHGLERQTLESIELLRKRKCPFVVALNKIDTIYGWKAHPNAPSRDTLKKQSKHTLQLFDQKVKETITLFAEQGLNACLYYKNKDFKKYVSLVPTSAITGEGIPDLLMLMCVLTQNLMASKITYKNVFECTVLEVKVVEGHGHTIDVILSNGVLRETDTIVLCGLNGPIVTKIRALLTPKPLKEIRVKGEYVHHKEIKASMGIKIAAQNLDQAVPGTQMLVVRPDDDIEELKEKVMEDFAEVMSRISTTGRGVYVASSTLGSLEALLSFLKDAGIPVAHISIGPVHKRDVTICSSMKEKAPEYAIILAFDVPITKEAQDLADKEDIKIFAANIIYHLFDRYTEHLQAVKEEKKQANAKNAIWPCILNQTGDVFHSRDPITIGVTVEKGELRVGTPCVAITDKGEKVDLGTVTGIQHEKKARQVAKEGETVAVSFDSGNVQHGRHITSKDRIVSKLHRGSIEAIKEGFKEELLANNQYFLRAIVEVKKILGLQ